MTDNEKLMKYSLKTRAKGRLRYSVEQGLIFGFVVFLVSNLLHLDEKSFSEIYFSWRGLINLGMYILIGIIFSGTFMWWVNERTIRNLGGSLEKGR